MEEGFVQNSSAATNNSSNCGVSKVGGSNIIPPNANAKTSGEFVLFKLIPDDMQKDIAATKINKQVIETGSKIDLHSILPDKFFDVPYIL